MHIILIASKAYLNTMYTNNGPHIQQLWEIKLSRFWEIWVPISIVYSGPVSQPKYTDGKNTMQHSALSFIR